MKSHLVVELPSGKNSAFKNIKKVFLPILTLALFISVSFYFNDCSESLLYASSEGASNNSSSTLPAAALSREGSTVNGSRGGGIGFGKAERCNIFNGSWVLHPEGQPYYTNETKCVMDDRQNCMKFGRPDSEFIKWRWKPNECELPLFDAMHFLEIVRGKTLAFLGDSVGRNQMQSLVCMLATAASPEDVSYVPDTRFRRWFYADYNFTIEALWSPNLVRAYDADPSGYSANSLMALHLDEADDAWTNRIQVADIVIVSAGQWFFRPYLFYEKGHLVGCSFCNNKNITKLTPYYGYRMAFRTTFQSLISNKNFSGSVFLRTFSPSHFENGDWDKGGNCIRTRPFSKEEMRLDGYNLVMYMTQVEEFRAAEKKGGKKGLKFRMLDTSDAMILRPDGHPNHYGHWPSENKTLSDCVHWCMPGPVDTWNEFLLEMLKREEYRSQRNH